MTIAEMAQAAFQNSRSKGFHDGPSLNIGEKLMLMVSELAEALEEHRDGNFNTYYRYRSEGTDHIENVPEFYGVLGKPEGFIVELADVIIRIGDLAGALGRAEELEKVLLEKMAYNRTRPHKHGKAY
jgi:hypothetical protein